MFGLASTTTWRQERFVSMPTVGSVCPSFSTYAGLESVEILGGIVPSSDLRHDAQQTPAQGMVASQAT